MTITTITTTVTSIDTNENMDLNMLLMAAGAANLSTVQEQAKAVEKYLNAHCFTGVFKKVLKRGETEQEVREFNGTRDFEMLAARCDEYNFWQEKAAAKEAIMKEMGLTKKTKESWESGNVKYWDMDKMDWRNFKLENLVTISITK